MKKNKLPLIVGGLAVVALGGFLFLPNLLAGGAPFLLLLLVCPLMMLFMMGGMQHTQGQGNQKHSDHLSQPTLPPWSGLTHEEQIAELKARLSHLEAQPASLSNTDGDRDKTKTQGPIIVEAEAIARAAEYPNHRHI